jgi:hypothetical protein
MSNDSKRPILVLLTSHLGQHAGSGSGNYRGLLLAVRPAGPVSRPHQQHLLDGHWPTQKSATPSSDGLGKGAGHADWVKGTRNGCV